jgi:hypothetical protein
MAVTLLKINIFKFWEGPVGICGNENGIPPLLKWDCGHCKPKIVPRNQLGVKMKPAVPVFGIQVHHNTTYLPVPYLVYLPLSLPLLYCTVLYCSLQYPFKRELWSLEL